MTDPLIVDFAGEVHEVAPDEVLTVGRSGDVLIDDNPYLHRIFLAFRFEHGLWWVCNEGARLPAYLTHPEGRLRSTLGPGGRLPLVFASSLVTFGAGSTLYEIHVDVPDAGFASESLRGSLSGESTISPGPFTESQLLCILALCEPVLRRAGTGAGRIPTTAEASARLGWSLKKFDKKVENVCDKLTAAGVRGLTTSGDGLASSRRLHLVEYAVSTLLVSADDLPMLDRIAEHPALHPSRTGGPAAVAIQEDRA